VTNQLQEYEYATTVLAECAVGKSPRNARSYAALFWRYTSGGLTLKAAGMRNFVRVLTALLAFGVSGPARGQIIDFESGGLKYKALTHNGVTLMFSPLTMRIRDYAILQVAVSNGSPVSWTVRPEDCRFEHADGSSVQALPAATVINKLIAKGSRGDVIKLVTAYEANLYNNTQFHSTNGYESRRKNAFGEVGSNKLKAGAAASAISFPTTKLAPGQSTDGAVFFPNHGKPLGEGKLIIHAAGEDYVFPVETETHPSER
jgi:hypothetical protein